MLLSKFIEASFGCIAILLAAIMALGASYSVGLGFGSSAYIVLAMALTGFAANCARYRSGAIETMLASGISTFVLVSILTAFNWKMQLVFFGWAARAPLQDMSTEQILMFVLTPLVLVALGLPFALRRIFGNPA